MRVGGSGWGWVGVNVIGCKRMRTRFSLTRFEIHFDFDFSPSFLS